MRFFPILATGGGEFHLIDIDKESPEYLQVFIFFPSQPMVTPAKAFYSIDAFLLSLIEAHKQGVYKITADGLLEINYELRQSLFASLNPEGDYWTME